MKVINNFRCALIMVLWFTSEMVLSSEIPTVDVQPAPDWVEVISFDTAKIKNNADILGGQYYLLYDNQINVLSKRVKYKHFAIQLLNETAVENNSRLTINFSPVFQSLVFHNAIIWRNGKALEQNIKKKLQLLQREEELENLIYDGRWTATILLDDVRKGDIIEYSYSITGQNPAYNDHINERIYLQWGNPIKKQFFRLLWPNKKRINITTTKKLRQELQTITHLDYKEYKIQRELYPTFNVDSETPDWFNPWDNIAFSTVDTWQDTVAWALPFYNVKKTNNADIKNIANSIQKKYQSKLEQASAALRYVQDEIRYVGIEVGAGSFVPSPPEVTLKRLYGDCKDKTFFLLSLLKLLDVEAYPVLANTRYGYTLEDGGPRLNAFNHVLVNAVINRKSYWLETTTNNQASTLNKIFQPDYGLALVIRSGKQSLVSMKMYQPYHKTILNEEYDLRSGINKSALYTINTIQLGNEAEVFRRKLNAGGKNKLEKQYFDYYKKTYKDIESISPIEIEDDEGLNRVSIVERYKITKFWYDNTNKKRHYGNFYNNDIYSYLTKPKVRDRNSPYNTYDPITIEHNIRVLLPDDWFIESVDYSYDTKFFKFSRKINFDNNSRKLQMNYNFQSLKKYIEVNEIDEYLIAIKKIKSQLDYRIYNSYDIDTQDEWVSSYSMMIIAIVTFIVLIAFSIVEFVFNQKKSPEKNDVRYYPVATSKVFVLSSFTYGLYLVYWFHKNWSYVKERDNSHIIPWGRAIFNKFWFYALYKSFQTDDGFSNINFTKGQNFRYGLLAVLFLVFSFISSFEHVIAYLAIILISACILPLVEKINHLTNINNEYYKFNSRWRIRHGIFLILFLSITFNDIASMINFIPNENVVRGDDVWVKDIKYMQRIGVLSTDEKLVLFYSDSFFSFKNDGNGLTDSGVFSYWRDENSNELKVEVAKFSDILDIHNTVVKNGASTIKITRNDKSNFVIFMQNSKKLNFYKTLNAKLIDLKIKSTE